MDVGTTLVTLKDGVVSEEHLDDLGYRDWPAYRKVSLTHAARVEGPFVVNTSEGPLKCLNGWLAVDARGYPYPIADDEFQQIYARADSSGMVTFNDHGNAMLQRIEELFDLHDPVLDLNVDACRDLCEAREHLNDALTRYNSARYRMNGTWGRQDSDRVISGAVGGLG